MQTPIPRKLETKQQEAIISNLETTIGKTKTRTDKPRKPTDEKTKRVKLRKKAAKKAFQIACNEGQDATKATKLKEYLEAQTTYRMAVEACERSRTEKRTETLVKKATIGPNEIWQARKRSQSRNELEYNTITEEAETLTDPEKTKEYIADYFEELYQARPGTPEYEVWTKHITDTMREIDNNRRRGKTPNKREQGDEDITTKEINTAIKKLRRRKSMGPDEIPNKVFIEADPTTRELLRQAIN